MKCIFCGNDSGIDLPDYKKICSVCHTGLEIDFDNIDQYLTYEEEELKNGTDD
jgi:hypothetical protein